MAKDYHTREIEATAVDTKTAAITLGSDATPGALNVPAGATELDAIIVSCGCDYVAAGSAALIVRLEGGGLPSGPYVIPGGAVGGESTTGVSSLEAAKEIKLGFPVKPGNEVNISIEMVGEDVGSIHSAVTLVFKVSGPSGGRPFDIITVEGSIADDAVKTALTTQGSTTAPSRQVPTAAKVISTLIAAASPDLAAAGAASFLVHIGGKGVQGGEQTIVIAGAGGAAVQSGADPVGLIMAPFVLEDADIPVVGGNTLTIEGELVGDDLGDATMTVGLIFA